MLYPRLFLFASRLPGWKLSREWWTSTLSCRSHSLSLIQTWTKHSTFWKSLNTSQSQNSCSRSSLRSWKQSGEVQTTGCIWNLVLYLKYNFLTFIYYSTKLQHFRLFIFAFYIVVQSRPPLIKHSCPEAIFQNLSKIKVTLKHQTKIFTWTYPIQILF